MKHPGGSGGFVLETKGRPGPFFRILYFCEITPLKMTLFTHQVSELNQQLDQFKSRPGTDTDMSLEEQFMTMETSDSRSLMTSILPRSSKGGGGTMDERQRQRLRQQEKEKREVQEVRSFVVAIKFSSIQFSLHQCCKSVRQPKLSLFGSTFWNSDWTFKSHKWKSLICY